MSGRALTAREAALQALYRVERDGAFLNLALPPLLGGLPPRERALARELASGTVRRRNTLDWSLELFLKRPLGELTIWMRNLLRLGAYQLLYLERIPAHAAVSYTHLLSRRAAAHPPRFSFDPRSGGGGSFPRPRAAERRPTFT